MNAEDYRKFVWAYRATISDQTTKSDQLAAFHIWQELSTKSYIRSAFYLGVCFDQGVGIRTDRKKAFSAFHAAAQDGHLEAQHNLYQMYRDGVGVERNIKKAIIWLKKAANGQDVEAIRDLGYCYHEGAGVKVNFIKAATLYRIAAKAGDAKAQWNLALCYRDADGVAYSNRWAMYWIQKSALNGHQRASAYMARQIKSIDQSDAGSSSVIGSKARSSMNVKTSKSSFDDSRYTDKPLGKTQVITDFLTSPTPRRLR